MNGVVALVYLLLDFRSAHFKRNSIEMSMGAPITCPQGKLTHSDPMKSKPNVKRFAKRNENKAVFTFILLIGMWVSLYSPVFFPVCDGVVVKFNVVNWFNNVGN